MVDLLIGRGAPSSSCAANRCSQRSGRQRGDAWSATASYFVDRDSRSISLACMLRCRAITSRIAAASISPIRHFVHCLLGGRYARDRRLFAAESERLGPQSVRGPARWSRDPWSGTGQLASGSNGGIGCDSAPISRGGSRPQPRLSLAIDDQGAFSTLGSPYVDNNRSAKRLLPQRPVERIFLR